MILKLLFILALIFPSAVFAQSKNDLPPYSHTYFLFESQARLCSDCYVPLLITRYPIEEIIKHNLPADNVLIHTYERYAVWDVREKPVPLDQESFKLQERIIMLPQRDTRGVGNNNYLDHRLKSGQMDAEQKHYMDNKVVTYRYQEVPKEEAANIIADPHRDIPVSMLWPSWPDHLLGLQEKLLLDLTQ